VLQESSRSASKQIAMRLSSSLSLWLGVATLVVGTIAFYSQDLTLIFTNAINDEATSYLLIIPLVIAYLVYRKRKMLIASIAEAQPNKNRLATVSGILLCATAVLLYWYGSTTFTPLDYHMLTMPIFVTGLVLLLFNPQTLRQAAFPTLFLFFLVPPPLDFFNTVGSTLAVASSQASNALVNLFGVSSTLTNEFGTPTITISLAGSTTWAFYVNVACSGIYSLTGFIVFATFIAFIVRDKLWKKTIAFAIGIPLVYALNIVRITTIILIGYQWGQDLALNVFHLFGGWILIFLGTLILLLITEKVFKTRIFSGDPNKTTCLSCNPRFTGSLQNYCPSCGRLLTYPAKKLGTLDAGKIGAIALVVALLVATQAPVYALTKGPAQILIQTPDGEQGNTQIFPKIPGYNLQFVYRDTDFEKITGQSLALIYAYEPQNESLGLVWLALEVATSTSYLHGWQTCLLSWPVNQGLAPKVTQLDARDITILQNPPITARFFAYNSTTDSQTWVVLYWYETSVFNVNNSSQQQHVEISLISQTENFSASEQQLQPLALAIADYWQPIKTWDFAALFLSKNSITLAETTTILLVATLMISIYKTRERKKVNKVASQKLSKQNQQLIESIQKVEKPSNANLNRIREIYEQTMGKAFSNEYLQKDLLGLEKTGLVSRRIINVNDSPVQAWQAEMGKYPREPATKPTTPGGSD